MRTVPMFLTEEPIIQFCGDGRTCVLKSEIRFRDSGGRVWVASPGEQSDGASIPAILWPWIGGPYEGDHRDGAFLHDAAYQEAPAGEASFFAADRSAARAAADRMLLEATHVRSRMLARHRGILARLHARFRAFAIYHGLRIGGAFAWMEHARYNSEAEISAGSRNQ